MAQWSNNQSTSASTAGSSAQDPSPSVPAAKRPAAPHTKEVVELFSFEDQQEEKSRRHLTAAVAELTNVIMSLKDQIEPRQ